MNALNKLSSQLKAEYPTYYKLMSWAFCAFCLLFLFLCIHFLSAMFGAEYLQIITLVMIILLMICFLLCFVGMWILTIASVVKKFF